MDHNQPRLPTLKSNENILPGSEESFNHLVNKKLRNAGLLKESKLTKPTKHPIPREPIGPSGKTLVAQNRPRLNADSDSSGISSRTSPQSLTNQSPPTLHGEKPLESTPVKKKTVKTSCFFDEKGASFDEYQKAGYNWMKKKSISSHCYSPRRDSNPANYVRARKTLADRQYIEKFKKDRIQKRERSLSRSPTRPAPSSSKLTWERHQKSTVRK